MLQLPNENTPGPGNIANEMQSDPDVTEALLPLTQGGSSRVTYGNLLTLPVTGGLMYVQPIYATRQLSDASYPILRYVDGLVRRRGRHRQHARARRSSTSSAATSPRRPTTAVPTTTPARRRRRQHPPTRVRNLLAQAEHDFEAADRAFAEGKVGQWATLIEEGRAKVDEAIRILNERDRTPAATGQPEEPPPSRVRPSLDLGRSGRGVTLAVADAGWSSSVARWAHNPEVAGSNPAPATK